MHAPITASTSEPELATRAQSGDRIAAAYLIAPRFEEVHKFFRAVVEDPIDAGEATREALEEALRSLAFFAPERQSFRTWLFGHIGSRAARRRGSGGMLGSLPLAEREVMALRCAVDLDWEEIAEITGFSEAAVRLLHEHAIDSLVS